MNKFTYSTAILDAYNFLLKNKIMNRYLGKNILRSETAPVVVAAIIRNHFGKIT